MSKNESEGKGAHTSASALTGRLEHEASEDDVGDTQEP